MSISTSDTDRLVKASDGPKRARLALRPISPSERQDEVLSLLQSVMSDSPDHWSSHRLWQWKHIDNPFGPSLVLVAEAEDGRIAGLRAFMRWRFRTPGRSLEAYRPVDTATHPDFRRQGIFTRLTLQAVEHSKQAGGDIIFNTPNSMSVSGYLKMGWTQIGVATPSLKIRSYGKAALSLTNRTARRRLGLSVSNETTLPPVPDALQPRNVINSDFEPLIEQVRDEQRLISTDKSVPYLIWRYAQNPLYEYGVIADREAGKLTGACIVRMAPGASIKTLVFEEFLVAEPNSKSVKRLVDMAFDAFKPVLGSAYSPTGTTSRDVLDRAGFGRKSRSNINFVAMSLSGSISPDPQTMSNWAVEMSELEIF